MAAMAAKAMPPSSQTMVTDSVIGETLNRPSVSRGCRPPCPVNEYCDRAKELSVLRKTVDTSMQQKLLPGTKTLAAKKFMSTIETRRRDAACLNDGDEQPTWSLAEEDQLGRGGAADRNLSVNTCALLDKGALKTRVKDAYSERKMVPLKASQKVSNSYVNRKTKLSETTRTNNLIMKKILNVKSTLPPRPRC